MRWFHHWRWRHPLRYNRRNHRKLLVVDGRRAFFGGFNIPRELAPAAPVVPREWLGRGWPKRLSEGIGWLLRRWL